MLWALFFLTLQGHSTHGLPVAVVTCTKPEQDWINKISQHSNRHHWLNSVGYSHPYQKPKKNEYQVNRNVVEVPVGSKREEVREN